LAIIIFHAITGVWTPACLLAASISVEAVTPPLVGMAILKSKPQTLRAHAQRATSNLSCDLLEVNLSQLDAGTLLKMLN